MITGDFEVIQPDSVADVVSALDEHGDGASVYAGGVEILQRIKEHVVNPRYLIDIKKIDELRRIDIDEEYVTIGAITTHDQLAQSPLIERHFPLLKLAEEAIGNIRVRSRGTVGGNLCFADPHTDSGTALLALNAHVALQGLSGTRVLPLSELYMGPNMTSILPTEVMTEVRAPLVEGHWFYGYERLSLAPRGTAANVAVMYKVDATGRLSPVRIAVGSVGSRPIRVAALEQVLSGVKISHARDVVKEQYEMLCAELPAEDDFLGSAEFKIHVVEALLVRALIGANATAAKTQE